MVKNKIKLIFLISITSFLLIFSFTHFAYAQNANNPNANNPNANNPSATITPTYTPLPNPLYGTAKSTPPREFFSLMVRGLLGIVGTLSLVVFIYGGIIWLTSSGNPEQVGEGKKVFIYALIGLIVTFSSYAVLRLLIDTLTET